MRKLAIELISLNFIVEPSLLEPILYTLWTILGVFVCKLCRIILSSVSNFSSHN